ncbi:MAG TPA: hypothetical protein ENF91_00560, partial [Thermoplasmatales archaeon]|nr:hypothetical protein [Thermoplasmatales archaeon]
MKCASSELWKLNIPMRMIKMARITVNGKEIDVPEGKNLLTVLREKGENIPGMCHMPELDPYG